MVIKNIVIFLFNVYEHSCRADTRHDHILDHFKVIPILILHQLALPSSVWKSSQTVYSASEAPSLVLLFLPLI